MKRFFPFIAIFLLAGSASLYAQQEEQRVVRAHYAGSIIFQTPAAQLDSIKANADQVGPGAMYLTFYYSDATWSRRADMLDSITFAMSSDGDTTIVNDTMTVDTSNMVRIVWNGSQVSITNPYPTDSIKVTVDGGHVTVKSVATSLQNVVYDLSGASSDGWILFSKLSTNAIMRMNGVQLTASGCAAINVDKNQNVLLHLVKGTINSLADADSNADKAVLYGKGTITVQGQGSLDISSSYANGLQGKRGVTITDGDISIVVSADASKGIKSDQDFVMNGGRMSITAAGNVVIDTNAAYETGYDMSYCTGIKTGDSEEGSVGNIIVNGGDLTIDCPATNNGGRCMSTDYNVIFNGGNTVMTTAGNGSTVGGTGTNAVDGYVSECVKADSNICLYGGHVDARSSGLGGRGLVADGSMIMGVHGSDDARLYVYVQTSGNAVNAVGGGGPGGPGGPGGWGGGDDDYFKGLPKAIKIEGNIYINSGHLGAYCAQTSGDPTGEAIESKDSIFINGGVVEANAYDDAINASKYLEINDGKVWCYSRGNDAIDCNANTNIHGGLVIVKGNEVGIDAATDAGGHFFIDGGTIITQGGTMGAWDTPNVSGRQKYLQLSNNGSNGICVKNSNGEVIMMYKHTNPSGSGFIENYTDPGAKPPGGGGGGPGGGGNTIVFSSPDVVSGTYQYWTSTTFNGGTSWHGIYFDATPTTSGNSQSTQAR